MFVQERTRHKQQVDKILQDAQIKLSGVVSGLFGLSDRAMMNSCSTSLQPAPRSPLSALGDEQQLQAMLAKALRRARYRRLPRRVDQCRTTFVQSRRKR
ncbi:hypothetical protein ACFYXC_38215 [Streptomyces sp. NPDC002701]|uniref:hypothetical protein n=1 Tax=Streptomyces sp. NPDC002701 TaxID=3364661 RepID=UPI0036B7844D